MTFVILVPIILEKSNGEKPSLSHLLIREVHKVTLPWSPLFILYPLFQSQTLLFDKVDFFFIELG